MSFVLLGTMIILNLFIGVIMAGMSEAQEEAEDEERRIAQEASGGVVAISLELADLNKQLSALQLALVRVQRRVARDEREIERLKSEPPPPMPVMLEPAE